MKIKIYDKKYPEFYDGYDADEFDEKYAPFVLDTSDEFQDSEITLNMSISKEIVAFMRLVSRSKSFETDIKMIRKKYKLPKDGYEIIGWKVVLLEPFNGNIEKYMKVITDIDEDAENLATKYKITSVFKSQLHSLIMGNYIYDIDANISHDVVLNDSYPKSLQLNLKLTNNKVTAHQIYQYLDKIWRLEIANKVSELPDSIGAFDAENVDILAEVERLSKLLNPETGKKYTRNDMLPILKVKFPKLKDDEFALNKRIKRIKEKFPQ